MKPLPARLIRFELPKLVAMILLVAWGQRSLVPKQDSTLPKELPTRQTATYHTTFSLADSLTRKPHQLTKHAPERLHWDMGTYFQQDHPELWESDKQLWEVTN